VELRYKYIDIDTILRYDAANAAIVTGMLPFVPVSVFWGSVMPGRGAPQMVLPARSPIGLSWRIGTGRRRYKLDASRRRRHGAPGRVWQSQRLAGDPPSSAACVGRL